MGCDGIGGVDALLESACYYGYVLRYFERYLNQQPSEVVRGIYLDASLQCSR